MLAVARRHFCSDSSWLFRVLFVALAVIDKSLVIIRYIDLFRNIDGDSNHYYQLIIQRAIKIQKFVFLHTFSLHFYLNSNF